MLYQIYVFVALKKCYSGHKHKQIVNETNAVKRQRAREGQV